MKMNYLAIYTLVTHYHSVSNYWPFEHTYVCHLEAKKVFSANRLAPSTMALVASTTKLHEGLEHLILPRTVFEASITKPIHTKQSPTVLHYKETKRITGRKAICKVRGQTL